VNAVGRKKDMSELSFIIAEAVAESHLLNLIGVVQVKRECKAAANELAWRTIHPAVWLREVPACVIDIKSGYNSI
jgi:hypothetical protein